MIPYSAEVYFAILGEHNHWIWPAQAVAFVLGLVALWLAVAAHRWAGHAVAAVLSLAWVWVGLVHYLAEFSAIDFWSYGFAVLFVVQGAGLLWSGVSGRRFSFGNARALLRHAGIVLAMIGLVLYPLAAWTLGHGIDETGYFGTAPAPTVIFTLGVLLLARPVAPLALFVVPLVWCAIAGAIAVQLGIHEDLLLIAVGVAVAAVLLYGRAGVTAG